MGCNIELIPEFHNIVVRPTTMSQRNSIPLLPLLSVNFIGTLGYSIILPFLIFLVADFGGNAVMYGIISATYSVFQFIGAPLLGKWSDRSGRKRILLLSQAGTCLAWVIFLGALFLPDNIIGQLPGEIVLSVPLLVIFVARAVDGLTGGNVSVANAYLADITPEQDRKKNFGKMSASANLGYIIGPAMAGVLGATMLGVKLPIIAALVISLVALVIIYYRLPESKMCDAFTIPEEENARKVLGQEHQECYAKKEKDKMSFAKVLKLPNVAFLLILYFLIYLGFNVFYTAFPAQAMDNLKWSTLELGIFFSLLSAVMILVQGPGLNWIGDKVSDAKLTVIGCLLLVANFALLVSGHIVWIGLAAVLFGIGNGLMWPSFLSLLSKTVKSDLQGTVQGYAGSAGSLAAISGLLAGGYLFEWLGNWSMLVPAGVMFVVLLLTLRFMGGEGVSPKAQLAT